MNILSLAFENKYLLKEKKKEKQFVIFGFDIGIADLGCSILIFRNGNIKKKVLNIFNFLSNDFKERNVCRKKKNFHFEENRKDILKCKYCKNDFIYYWKNLVFNAIEEEIIIKNVFSFKTNRNEIDSFRLNKIFLLLKNLIRNFRPNFCSIEKIFFTTNASSCNIINEVIGVIKLAFYYNGKIPFDSFSPHELKRLISDNKKDKNIIINFVKNNFLYKKIYFNFRDDIADSICINVLPFLLLKDIIKI